MPPLRPLSGAISSCRCTSSQKWSESKVKSEVRKICASKSRLPTSQLITSHIEASAKISGVQNLIFQRSNRESFEPTHHNQVSDTQAKLVSISNGRHTHSASVYQNKAGRCSSPPEARGESSSWLALFLWFSSVALQRVRMFLEFSNTLPLITSFSTTKRNKRAYRKNTPS